MSATDPTLSEPDLTNQLHEVHTTCEQLHVLCRELRSVVSRASMEQKARYTELATQLEQLDQLVAGEVATSSTITSSTVQLASSRAEELRTAIERFSRHIEPGSVVAA